ncbi:MAG: alpha/beta fold hydrolase [Actinomycetota bacterium]
MRQGYVVANGIRVYYVEEGDGPLVLMCHGFPETHFSWRHQMAPIARAGFRAVAIDLPGYGRSDKPDVAYDIDFVGNCLAEVVTGLGHDRAVMVGHDWGALQVWPFARIHADRTAAVIAFNVPDLPRLDIPPIELFRQLGTHRTNYILEFQERGTAEDKIEGDLDGFFELMLRGPATVKKEVMTNDVIETFKAQFRPRGAITPALEYYRNMDRNWELIEPYDGTKIEVPCLMVMAEGDRVLPPKLADGMEERVPNVEKVVFEDCGHWTQQEQPERTNEGMVSFLERHRAAFA